MWHVTGHDWVIARTFFNLQSLLDRPAKAATMLQALCIVLLESGAVDLNRLIFATEIASDPHLKRWHYSAALHARDYRPFAAGFGQQARHLCCERRACAP